MSKLFRYKNGQWRLYRTPETLITTAEVSSLALANDSLWLLGLGDEVQKFDYSDNRWIKYDGLNFECETRDGKQWFVSVDEGVISFDGTQWLRYGMEDGSLTFPRALMCTRRGDLWAVGAHNGSAATACFDGTRWTVKSHTNLNAQVLDYRAVFEASNGDLWFSTYVDGVRHGNGGPLRYSPAAGPPEEDAAWRLYGGDHHTSYGFAQTADGTLYSGSYLGAAQLSQEAWIPIVALRGKRIDTVCSSAEGKGLWPGTDHSVKVEVEDNGVGIPANNLVRIFAHGFSSHNGKHSLGLHSGALAAMEMGGTLSAHSDGPGKGARFTLELPLRPKTKQPR
jgi:hypothetical protein